MQDCIFCKIVKKEISAQFVLEDNETFAIRDVNPQAPTHFLVMPKKHLASLHDCSKEEAYSGAFSVWPEISPKRKGCTNQDIEWCSIRGPEPVKASFISTST